jgi:hypothetical protein
MKTLMILCLLSFNTYAEEKAEPTEEQTIESNSENDVVYKIECLDKATGEYVYKSQGDLEYVEAYVNTSRTTSDVCEYSATYGE